MSTFPRVISLRTRSTRISAPPPGRLPSPASFSRFEHDRQRLLADLREVMNLRWAEAVDVDLRKPCFDVGEQLLVPFERQLRVQASLHQDLVAAECHRLVNLLVQHVARQDVHLFVPRRPIKRAEVADRGTLVGVIDVAVDVVRAKWLRMQPPCHGVGRLPKRDEVVRFEQRAVPLRGSAVRRQRLSQAVVQSRKTSSAPPGTSPNRVDRSANNRSPLRSAGPSRK